MSSRTLRRGRLALLDGGVGAEGSEEVGEEGSLGWHFGVPVCLLGCLCAYIMIWRSFF